MFVVTGPVWSQTVSADSPLRPYGNCSPLSSPRKETCALFLGCMYLQTFLANPHKCVSCKIVLTYSKVLWKTFHFCRTSGLSDVNKHQAPSTGRYTVRYHPCLD